MRSIQGRLQRVSRTAAVRAWQSLCAAMLLPAVGLAQAGTIAPELERAMALRGTHADTAVIVRFTDPVDPGALAVGDRRARDNRVLTALRARAAARRPALQPQLAALGAQRVSDLWIINGLAATLPAVSVRALAALDGVARVDLDSFVPGAHSRRTPVMHTAPPIVAQTPPPDRGAAGSQQALPQWNIAAVQAPSLWAQGHTGSGVVVAAMDTGVDLAHPELQRKWRGGSNAWFDPHGEEPAPYDALGHGTQTMGVVLGGHALGVAPDARWIGVRLFDGDGRARMSDIHRAFQWLLDPDGDAATLDAPDIVNASWTLSGRAAGACVDQFGDDIRALRAAGIAVVFAAGSDGPAPRTSSSPANNRGAVSVGAVDATLAVARQSSRGPSACDAGVFPKLLAPGVNVRTADLSHGGTPSYAVVSGSSVAAPHVSGVLALLMSAFPDASLDELERALVDGARKLEATGPGIVDARAAYDALRATRDLRLKVVRGTKSDHDAGH